MDQPGSDPTFVPLTLADMVGPVSHDLRNLFNQMVLKAAVLSRTAPEPLRGDLAEFRTMAVRASDMLGALDRYRRGLKANRQPVDLNRIAGEAVEEARQGGVTVTLDLAPQVSSVMAHPTDLRRLLRLLIQLAAALPDAGAPTVVRTEQSGTAPRLCVTDGGPPLTEEQAEAFFAPFGPARAGQAGLERAACHTIAQRIQAQIHVENRPEGVTVVVDFGAP